MAGKHGIPYFSNFVNSDLSPEDALYMCCRLRLDKRELLKRKGGLFGANPLTGSIGVVTINLPRIGYLSANENEFFEHLGKMVLLAAESLSIKTSVLEKFTDKNLYPYSTFYLRSINQATGYYWQYHFSTMGIIGMNEACLNFLGTSIVDKAGLEFSLKVMDFFHGLIAKLQEKSDAIYNLEATPAEGTSYCLALLDKKKFPEILGASLLKDLIQHGDKFVRLQK
jgi:ribonucleoside-triphosphate reductase